MSNFKKIVIVLIMPITFISIWGFLISNPFLKKGMQSTSSEYDYGIASVLEKNLLKAVPENEVKFEKIYFDGIRLYVLIKKDNAKEYTLGNIKLKSNNKFFEVDHIIDVDNENRMFVWDYIEIHEKTIDLECTGSNGKKDFVFEVQDNKSNFQDVNTYFEELYVEECAFGSTSFYIRFKLNDYSTPSSFQIQYDGNVMTGYIISEKDKIYEVVFPIDVALNNRFNIIINGEDGTVNKIIPMKFEY